MGRYPVVPASPASHVAKDRPVAVVPVNAVSGAAEVADRGRSIIGFRRRMRGPMGLQPGSEDLNRVPAPAGGDVLAVGGVHVLG